MPCEYGIYHLKHVCVNYCPQWFINTVFQWIALEALMHASLLDHS